VDKVDLNHRPLRTPNIVRRWGSRSATARCGPPHHGDPEPGEIRHAVPGLVGRADTRDDRANTVLDALAASPGRPRRLRSSPASSVGVPEVGRGARGGEEARVKKCFPRMGNSQPRLRPPSPPRKGRQARFRLGGGNRPRGKPTARCHEEKKIRLRSPLHYYMYPAPGPWPRRRGRNRSPRRSSSSISLYQ